MKCKGWFNTPIEFNYDVGMTSKFSQHLKKIIKTFTNKNNRRLRHRDEVMKYKTVLIY